MSIQIEYKTNWYSDFNKFVTIYISIVTLKLFSAIFCIVDVCSLFLYVIESHKSFSYKIHFNERIIKLFQIKYSSVYLLNK